MCAQIQNWQMLLLASSLLAHRKTFPVRPPDGSRQVGAANGKAEATWSASSCCLLSCLSPRCARASDTTPAPVTGGGGQRQRGGAELHAFPVDHFSLTQHMLPAQVEEANGKEEIRNLGLPSELFALPLITSVWHYTSASGTGRGGQRQRGGDTQPGAPGGGAGAQNRRAGAGCGGADGAGEL